MKHALALAALASCLTNAAHAAPPPPPVPENLLTCRKLQDDSERVRCYDKEIEKLTRSAAPPSLPSTAAATKESAAAQFGQDTLPAAARPKTPAEDQLALISSITAMRAVAPQIYVISLSNGQVWRQEQASQTALFFRVGDNVRIERGALGSYHMSTDATGGKNWVRVTRIQ